MRLVKNNNELKFVNDGNILIKFLVRVLLAKDVYDGYQGFSKEKDEQKNNI